MGIRAGSMDREEPGQQCSNRTVSPKHALRNPWYLCITRLPTPTNTRTNFQTYQRGTHDKAETIHPNLDKQQQKIHPQRNPNSNQTAKTEYPRYSAIL